MEQKLCKKCGEHKLVEEFALKGEGKRNANCKECHRKYSKSHYQSNKKYYCDKGKKNKDVVFSRNLEVIKPLKEKPCVDCNGRYPHYVMDFDHLREKQFNVSEKIRYLSLEKLLAEISKCELVCANCHRIRTHNRQQKLCHGGEVLADAPVLETGSERNEGSIPSRDT